MKRTYFLLTLACMALCSSYGHGMHLMRVKRISPGSSPVADSWIDMMEIERDVESETEDLHTENRLQDSDTMFDKIDKLLAARLKTCDTYKHLKRINELIDYVVYDLQGKNQWTNKKVKLRTYLQEIEKAHPDIAIATRSMSNARANRKTKIIHLQRVGKMIEQALEEHLEFFNQELFSKLNIV